MSNQAVKIKKLEWTEKTFDISAHWWESQFINMSVEPMDGGFMLWKDNKQMKSFDVIEDAFEYAQEYFEKQVKKFLV
jgi:hypothetical protein